MQRHVDSAMQGRAAQAGCCAACCRSARRRGELEVARLDDVLAGALGALAGRVGAVKIDVEGHELAVGWLVWCWVLAGCWHARRLPKGWGRVRLLQ